MKKLIACASALIVLSACAEEAVEEPAVTEEEVAAEPAADTMESYLGDWDVVYPDGSTGVTTNNADGTFNVALAGGSSGTGLWSFGEAQSCWHTDGEEEAKCYTVGEPDENGTRVLSSEDGNDLTVTPVAAEEETAEGDEA